MFKNKNTEFWFWFALACINVVTIMVANENNDETTCIIGGCMLLFSFAQGLTCAIEIDKDQ